MKTQKQTQPDPRITTFLGKVSEKKERTVIIGANIRTAGDDKGPGKLEGYAAVFNRQSVTLWPGFREILVPGCFGRALEDKSIDCKAHFVNHNGDLLPLGRYCPAEGIETLRVKQDDRGLFCEIDLPDTTGGRDIYESVKRQDITQMSFMFRTPEDGSGEQWVWDESGGIPVRYVTEVSELLDVTPATFPAYKDTTLVARTAKMDPETQQRAKDLPIIMQAFLDPDRDLDPDLCERAIKFFQEKSKKPEASPAVRSEKEELSRFLEIERLRS